jgi:hypothetical protein
MVRAFAILFACTTAVLAAMLVWPIALQSQRASQPERYDQDIVFPIKIFVGTTKYVAAKGTLSADWMAYQNNTFSFYCDPKECIVASISQIGPKMIGTMDGPTVYTTKRWTEDDDVVAEDDASCSRITITLDRKTESVSWVETPINQTTLTCKNTDDSVRKATLEASLHWRRQSLK